MSTPRRALGAGPTSSTRPPAAIPAPRLLPAERADVEQHQAVTDDEHQAVKMPEGRRHLGTGPGGASWALLDR
ncbi:hypothetical protein OHA84_38670 [Streptomyces sp. NBC_00513]|uniref:hypothetical protein n=1 Tax=unclassified Streptomyces TaxID=2593676 RepID=UPI00224FB88C|nr:hypothetical protein [Streptomyces sp. NBC_00424]MCX5079373.1 hypothetical protein [Streptomyces sp. NBC_00424]MCX5079383.1 hypothetical protein [Streptomyces sp. NBC_00424]WUD46455.1 hypothetical protein OHA84_38720 [Streptomyces sp. NBC_00513]WUD46465.1 hypothetical protein OHA84_38670 [Streptomyces sp. NBC_00513]